MSEKYFSKPIYTTLLQKTQTKQNMAKYKGNNEVLCMSGFTL